MKSRSTKGADARRDAWREAARTIFAPVVEALLREGWRYPDLVQVLQESVIEAAPAANPEDLSRRTGLPRAAAKRQRKARALPLSYTDASRLIGRWMSDPPFAKDGAPQPLAESGTASFAELAAAAGVDAGVALRHLCRTRAVEVSGGRVHLRQPAYLPQGGLDEKLDIMGRDAAELIRVMVRNVRSQKPTGRLFQRKACYDNIGSEALDSLRDSLGEIAMQAVMSANTTLAHNDRDRRSDAPGGRRSLVSFGVYLLDEPVTRRKPAARRRRSK